MFPQTLRFPHVHQGKACPLSTARTAKHTGGLAGSRGCPGLLVWLKNISITIYPSKKCFWNTC